CSPTASTGRPVKYWKNPIPPWASSTPTSTAAGRRSPAGLKISSATDSPTSSITRSACSWATVAGSSPVRPAAASAASGPLPVPAPGQLGVREQQAGHGQAANHADQGAVAELDHAVQPQPAGCDQRGGVAARPGRAAHPGVAESDNAARDHNPDIRR